MINKLAPYSLFKSFINSSFSVHGLSNFTALLLFFVCAISHAEPNLMGIQIAAPLDGEERIYANAISTSREFKNGADPNNPVLAIVDANGWPTSDASFYVWHNGKNRHGTYSLSFKGQASVDSNIGTIPVTYDPATNTSSATFQFTDSSPTSYLSLSFTNTKRTNVSAVGTGITSITLMQPLTPGSTQSYPPSVLFSSPLKALISKFSVIRFMDFLATNANLQKNWSDRMLPSSASFSRNPGGMYGWQGLGGPWEHVIKLMNETGKDGWINLPVDATDTYIRNVALMFAYGSDGTNPYSSPQANPVYPPLNANLKVYVEYSNDLWRWGAFTQSEAICQAASDELVSMAGNSPLNWDGAWNNVAYQSSGPNDNWNWFMCSRYSAKRSVEISNIFRSVFGDAEMTARIRPVLMSQQDNPGYFLSDQMQMMLNYYNNMAGNFVAVPHPPNYYLYGAGGSGAYTSATSVSSVDELFMDSGMTPAGMAPVFEAEARLITAMGLKHIAYSGGPSLDRTEGPRDVAAAQAVDDPRMTTAMVNMHNEWSSKGGDLLVYFTATGDYQWGFTSDVHNLSTPKLAAIDNLSAAQRAPLTLGTLVPGNVAGNVPDTCSRAWSCNPLWDNFTSDGSGIVWASYNFRSSVLNPWTVNLDFNNASNSTVAVYVDGVLIGTQNTSGTALSFPAGNINAGLHSVIVRAVTGTFSLNRVSISDSPTTSVPGAPTMGLASAGNTTAAVTFTAPASDGGSSISNYTATSNPGNVSASCTSSPCMVVGLTNGTSYTFTVTATNAIGTGPASAASNPVTPINNPPTVSLTAPANNALFSPPANITLAATAADDSGISRVEFYQGTVLLGTDVTSPYSFAWSNVPSGVYQIMAKAIDNQSAAASSNTVNITVGNPNLMGINISAPLDYAGDRLYADVMRVSRAFKIASNPNEGAASVPVDGNGWPTSDFSFYVWHGIDKMNGVYQLSFQGKADVAGSPTGPIGVDYNSVTNTSTAQIYIDDPTVNSYLTLTFTNTKRTSSSALGSGVTSIKLMRPLTPGSNESFPSTTLFNTPLKALIAKFSVIRFMDFSATNWNLQQNWSDRARPAFASFNRTPPGSYNGWQGLGGAWEHIILLMNETGKDGWINIPVGATDDYVLKVAQTFAFGSDGVNPYTSPQANPVYPPLNANLKLYVEYSNEVWNPMFEQTNDVCQFASNELQNTAGGSPLNWDRVWNNIPYPTQGWNWEMCPRYLAKRSVEISNKFRSVFGDSAMMTRIRPVLMTHLVNPGYFLSDASRMLLNYYNNMAGNFVATPRPPNYYFYGAGGSAYYEPQNVVTTVDQFFADAGLQPAWLTSNLEKESAWVAALGLKRIAYEGGPHLLSYDQQVIDVFKEAVNDSRMTGAIVAMHNAWSNAGGELLTYFTSTDSEYKWAFAPDVYQLNTRKIQAINDLNAASRAPLTVGKLVPGSINGQDPATCFTGSGSGCEPINTWDNFTSDGSKVVWASYSFRSTPSAPWTVNLSFKPGSVNGSVSVAVYVDGTLRGTQNTSGGNLSYNVGTVNSGLHGVVVRAVNGNFMLNEVAVSLN